MVEITTSAPGKIILCGEHAVVYGKEAVAFSLSTATRCCLKEDNTSPMVLRLRVSDLQIDKEIDLCEIEALYGQSRNFDLKKPNLLENEEQIYDSYLSSVTDDTKKSAIQIILVLYIHLAHQYVKKRNTGFSITFQSDLPIGAGLGSSASFAVSAVAAMLVLTGNLASDQNEWTDKDYHLINDWAFQSERIVHGTPSGIDNSVSTYGQCVSFKSKKVERLQDFSNLKLRVLVMNTKVGRSTKALVSGVRDRKQKFPLVYEHIMVAIEHVTNHFKRSLVELSKGERSANEIYKDMETLVDINQGLLNAIGVSHPTIEECVSICSRHAIHAKLTGAGGGGCLFALIPPSYPEDDLKQVQEIFERETTFEAWVATLGGDGVKLLSYETPNEEKKNEIYEEKQ